MEYREVEPPEALRPLVKLAWTLGVPADGPAWIVHVATPDGCLEVIRRLSGRSIWNGEQPDQFVAGAITRPTDLRIAAGTRFVAVRLWPWAWRLLTGKSPGSLSNRWMPLADAAPAFAMPDNIEAAFASMAACQAPADMRAMAAAIHVAHSAGEISLRTGRSPRSVQRWFEANVGQPPRSYLRMLRFGDALAELAAAKVSLAVHAQDHGFADQAHMAREFRELAGAPARTAKARAQGPFLSGK